MTRVEARRARAGLAAIAGTLAFLSIVAWPSLCDANESVVVGRSAATASVRLGAGAVGATATGGSLSSPGPSIAARALVPQPARSVVSVKRVASIGSVRERPRRPLGRALAVLIVAVVVAPVVGSPPVRSALALGSAPSPLAHGPDPSRAPPAF